MFQGSKGATLKKFEPSIKAPIPVVPKWKEHDDEKPSTIQAESGMLTAPSKDDDQWSFMRTKTDEIAWEKR